MKKVMILSILAATALSSNANAASDGTVCAAFTVAGNGTAFTAGGSSEFVRVAFTPKCSANVHVFYAQGANVFGVVSGSTKGKNYFGGGTGGGGVTRMGACASTGCSTTEMNTTNAQTKMNAS